MPFSDPTGGFKCFRRSALQSLDLNSIRSGGYSFQIEMTHRLWMSGMRVAEVPIIFTERLEGCSKMSGNIVWEALMMVWSLWIKSGFRRSPKKRREEGKL
jgi:dolichol-phosphate mannosyltransferase